MDSPFAPFSIPAWSDALRAVDQSPSCLLETSKELQQYGHYVFPDPGLFLGRATDEKKAQYIESWLRVRDAWFMRVANESSLAMSNQNWRTFLSIDLNVGERGETKAARRRREILEIVMPNSTVYPELKSRSASKDLFVWQGKEYRSGELPPEDIVRQILWELYEVNFIHELLSLDHRACDDLDLKNSTQLLERQLKISTCFPPSLFRHVTISSENRGLAADNSNTRFPFIIALFIVMKSWKGDKPVIFGASEDNIRAFTL